MPMFQQPMFVLKYVHVYANYTLVPAHISIFLFLPDMSTLNHLVDLQLQEQICYVQCGFCNTVLLVCVPYACLYMVVTVRCGHCTSFFSVNMMGSSFIPLPLFPYHQEDPVVEACGEDEDEDVTKLTLSKHSSSPLISSASSHANNDNDDDLEVVNRVVKKPPKKNHRVASAYNQFIREEIRRLKTQHPEISHKQAFSTAAKNWAHSPQSHQNEDDKLKGSGGLVNPH